MKLLAAKHGHQALVFDLLVIAPPAPSSAVARKAPLFDLHEHNFECQAGMGKDTREMDQLLKKIEHGALLGAAAAGDDLTAGSLLLHEKFAGDDRLDDPHTMFLHQGGDLVAIRRERAELDFDQLVAVDDVDSIAADPLLDQRAVRRVVGLELSVERGFHT